MKVWIVTEFFSPDCFAIVGVFVTEKKAKEHVIVLQEKAQSLFNFFIYKEYEVIE